MSHLLIHRLFMYSIIGSLLVAWLYTREDRVWDLLTRVLLVVGSVELMSYNPKAPEGVK